MDAHTRWVSPQRLITAWASDGEPWWSFPMKDMGCFWQRVWQLRVGKEGGPFKTVMVLNKTAWFSSNKQIDSTLFFRGTWMCATVLPHWKLLSASLAGTPSTGVALGKIIRGCDRAWVNTHTQESLTNKRLVYPNLQNGCPIYQTQPYQVSGVGQQSASLPHPGRYMRSGQAWLASRGFFSSAGPICSFDRWWGYVVRRSVGPDSTSKLYSQPMAYGVSFRNWAQSRTCK